MDHYKDWVNFFKNTYIFSLIDFDSILQLSMTASEFNFKKNDVIYNVEEDEKIYFI